MEPNTKLSRREKAELILRHLRGIWGFFAGAILLAWMNTVCNAIIPQIISVTVDSVLGAKEPDLPGFVAALLPLETLRAEPKTALWIAAGAVMLAAAVRGACIYGMRVNTAKASEGFVKKLRDNLYGHIQRLSFEWHTAHATGDIIQRCTSDVEVIRTFVCNQLMEVLRTVFLIVLYTGIMLTMNWRLALIPLAFIPVTGLASGVFYGKISSRFKTADEAEGEMTTCAQENLTGVRVVRAFGRERFEIDRFARKNDRFSALWVELGRVLSVYWASGVLLVSLQIMAVIVAGTVAAVSGSITLGDFQAFVIYNSAMAWPVRSLGHVLSEMSKAGVSMDRVGYILKAEEESDRPGAESVRLGGDIVFDHVTFGYEGQEVLRDVSFTIPWGSTFAILGGTGSGKSTLVHLLDRLYDLGEGQGSITIGGVDIRDIKREDLRRQIGLVLQEPFLFSQTIRENMAATRPGAAAEELRACARIACVDDAIADLQNGYETIVGERGVTLSGGQKQRVAIARMLLQNAPVMVFDDSLSAVDAETDAKIRAALKERMAEATVILISHRVTTLMQADRILVLDGGRVADMGTHVQLIARPGIYREIYDIQMSSDDRALLTENGGLSPRLRRGESPQEASRDDRALVEEGSEA